MSQRIYRVCRAVPARLDGEGARRVGGRWNSPGRSVVYIAETISLAVLENLVHLAKEDFPTGYVVVAAVVPDEILVLKEDLVEQFRGVDRRRLGDQWIDLLNPQHPDFAAITAEPTVPFVFDERLFGSRRVH